MKKDLILTCYNGKQPRKKCWYSARNNQFYLLGDVNKKDSGGAYKFKDGKHSSKRFVVWSNYLGCYVRKRGAQKVIINLKGDRDYVEETYQANQTIYVTAKERAYSVINDLDIEDFKFDMYTGVFYIGNQKDLKNNFPKARPKKDFIGYPNDVYNYADLPPHLKEQTIKGAKEEKPSFPHDIAIASGIGENTFGIEAETNFCLLPEKYLKHYGFIPVKDGSIKGNEIVSVPLSGLNGLRNVYGFMNKLGKYATANHTCSLHVHQGNLPIAEKDREKFIAALHWMYVQLQYELLEMVPGYKTDFRVLKDQAKGAGKDYCAAVPRLNLNGKSVKERNAAIFKWCNDFQEPCHEFNAKTRKHCKHGQPKWNTLSRYYSLNLFPWHFSDSGTIEYRLHHGTTDAWEAIHWLALTMGITNYVIDHMDQILNEKHKYDLEDVVNYVYDAQYAKVLNEHIYERKSFFTDQKLSGDNGLETTFKKEKLK